MNTQLADIREWTQVSRESFENEIVPLNQPAVLRGFVSDWAAVKNSDSAAEFVEYLKSFDSGNPVYTIVGEPSIQGRFFYTEDLRGVNFKRAHVKFSAVVDQILALKETSTPHAIAVQSAPVRTALPGFDQANSMPLLDPAIAPTMWLGNQATVAPHYDVTDNIAAVVCGRRKFTLFPPEQVANLYVGPALESPGGVPISLVDLDQPDFEKYPNFAKALTEAQTATLNPGDVIYIPSPWWHAVQSLDTFNMLVNYWWGSSPDHNVSPNNSLMHSILTIANLEPSKRASWKHLFDYYVFKESGDPKDHLPEDLQDILTTMNPKQLEMLLAFLKSKL